MKFKSKKDPLFTTVIYGVNGFIVYLLFCELSSGSTQVQLVPALILMAAFILLFWFYYDTGYELSPTEGLVYRSGPISGKIGVNRITKIIKGKTLWVGLKPATSRNGLIIKYDKFNEIYISPITNDLFIQKILELNDKIEIVE